MPALVDTSIRLLSQEPLAQRMQSSRVLELAEILDKAGFAYLEVSGGGCFDSAVRRGVESPWERIRAIRSRCSTPLGMALRGRLLVGSRPLSRDLVSSFVASAAESGIDIFRIHDPLNDLANLGSGRGDPRSGERACRRARAQPGPGGRHGHPARAGQAPRGARRVSRPHPRSVGVLDPARARELVERVGEASQVPVGLHCQGAGGAALASSLEAARAGAGVIACALYPIALSLHRVSAESLTQSLAGLGVDSGVDLETLWRGSELVDDALGDVPVPPLSPRVAVRAAEHSLPAGLVAELDANLRAHGFSDRLDEVLDELTELRRECGWPPLASPIGQILGSQAVLHVLSAQRWQIVVDELRDLIEGRFGSPPAEIDPTVRRAVKLIGEGARREETPVELDDVRDAADGLASSDEELLLLALFGEEAEPLLRSIRSRGGDAESLARAGLEQGEAERIRELIRIVQESGIGEVTIEEGETRVTVRRSDEAATVPAVGVSGAVAQPTGDVEAPVGPPADGTIRIEAPMVGTFYRAPEPGAEPFVEEGDRSRRARRSASSRR